MVECITTPVDTFPVEIPFGEFEAHLYYTGNYTPIFTLGNHTIDLDGLEGAVAVITTFLLKVSNEGYITGFECQASLHTKNPDESSPMRYLPASEDTSHKYTETMLAWFGSYLFSDEGKNKKVLETILGGHKRNIYAQLERKIAEANIEMKRVADEFYDMRKRGALHSATSIKISNLDTAFIHNDRRNRSY